MSNVVMTGGGALTSFAAGNVYQVPQADAGGGDITAVAIDLNGGTLVGATFKCRVANSGLALTACQGVRRSDGIATAAADTSDVFMFDTTGIELWIDVPANSGSPRGAWGYGLG